MFKKIWFYIRLAFMSIFYSMRSADKLLTSKQDELDGNDVGGIEQQQEKKSVYQDLLKGVVTEQVRELRHEMYYAERKSHDYVYAGGGHAKKTTMFDYNGNVDKSDGLKIILVQNNDDISYSLSETGLQVYGEDYAYNVEEIKGNIKNKTRSEKQRRINIDRKFNPRFKLENYTNKIVVKELNGDEVIIDMYVTKYPTRWETTSRLFHSEMEKIYEGFKRSDVLEFDRLYFTTYHAFGESDLKEIAYDSFIFEDISEFDGNYVLKFRAKVAKNNDIVQEFYHEATAEKCKNNAAREGAVVDFELSKLIQDRENYDSSEAENLIENVKKG